MRRANINRPLYAIFFVCMLNAISFICCADKISIDFDRLYPETPFKKTMRSCVMVLQEIDLLYRNKGEVCNYDLFADVIVGKLFCIKMNLEYIALQKPPAHKEDIVFLEGMFDKILFDYKSTCSGYLDKPKSGYVVQLIEDIKVKCSNLK